MRLARNQTRSPTGGTVEGRSPESGRVVDPRMLIQPVGNMNSGESSIYATIVPISYF